MHNKFEVNQIKIKGGCQSERTVVTNDSKSDLPLLLICNAIMQCYLTKLAC